MYTLLIGPRERNRHMQWLARDADAVVGAVRAPIDIEAKGVTQGFDILDSPVGRIARHPIEQLFAMRPHGR